MIYLLDAMACHKKRFTGRLMQWHVMWRGLQRDLIPLPDDMACHKRFTERLDTSAWCYGMSYEEVHRETWYLCLMLWNVIRGLTERLETSAWFYGKSYEEVHRETWYLCLVLWNVIRGSQRDLKHLPGPMAVIRRSLQGDLIPLPGAMASHMKRFTERLDNFTLPYDMACHMKRFTERLDTFAWCYGMSYEEVHRKTWYLCLVQWHVIWRDRVQRVQWFVCQCWRQKWETCTWSSLSLHISLLSSPAYVLLPPHSHSPLSVDGMLIFARPWRVLMRCVESTCTLYSDKCQLLW